MRVIHPIVRVFRRQLRDFGNIPISRNYLFRRVLYLMQKAVCLLECETPLVQKTTTFLSSGTQVIRNKEPLAKRTQVHNLGAVDATILENDIIVAVAPAGKITSLPLEGKGALRAQVEISGGYVASLSVGAPVGLTGQSVTGATVGFSIPATVTSRFNSLEIASFGKIKLVVGDFYVKEDPWVYIFTPPPTTIAFSFVYMGTTVSGTLTGVAYEPGLDDTDPVVNKFNIIVSNGITPLNVITHRRCLCGDSDSPYDGNQVSPTGPDLI